MNNWETCDPYVMIHPDTDLSLRLLIPPSTLCQSQSISGIPISKCGPPPPSFQNTFQEHVRMDSIARTWIVSHRLVLSYVLLSILTSIAFPDCLLGWPFDLETFSVNTLFPSFVGPIPLSQVAVRFVSYYWSGDKEGSRSLSRNEQVLSWEAYGICFA